MPDKDKLRWKARFDSNFFTDKNFLENLLKSYGVEDVEDFLYPQKNKVLNNPFDMLNMEKAVKVFFERLNEPIIIKCDPDCDGFTSTTLLTNIVKHYNPDANIKYVYSYEKDHGLTYKALSEFPKANVGMILIPDASMVCRDAIQITRNYDAPIIVLDHHLIEDEYMDKDTRKWIPATEALPRIEDGDDITVDRYTNYCIAVNDTDGHYPNPTLSGVGVVYKFGEACSKYKGEDDYWLNQYLDLVSLGMVADNMDLRNLETRWYVLEGLQPENMTNGFINELHERLKDEIHFKRTITNMGWTLAPRINGVCRYGTHEEQENLLRAFIGEDETIEYQPRRKKATDPKPPVEYHTLQWEMARVADNVKGRQDTAVRQFIDQIDKKIEEEELLKNSVLFVDCDEILDKKSVSGLCANKLTSKYLRPVVLLKSKNSTEFGGSGRGYEFGEIKDLNQFLTDKGVNCMGHSNAFGINLAKSNLTQIIAKCNEALPLDHLYCIHPVDWEIAGDVMCNRYVKDVAENYEIWGNTVPTPTFAITGIHVNAQDIKAYGANNSFIRFTYNGVTYIKKYCPSTEFEKMTMASKKTFGANTKNLVLNVIGQFQLEPWEDKVYPEVKILFYDVEEDTEALPVPKTEKGTASSAEKNAAPKKSKIEVVEKKVVKMAKVSTVEEEDPDFDDGGMFSLKPSKKKVELTDDDYVW